MLKKAILLIAVVIPFFTTLAQDMPEEQKNLMQFVGNWKLNDAKFTMGEETVTGVYTLDCSAVNDNTGIIAHEKFVTKDMGTLKGENLLGLDPYTGLIHLYSIDNFGTAHDHYGYWIDKNHLYVQYQGVVEGKMYVEQIDMKFSSPDKLELNLTGMLNGEVYSGLSGTFTK
jgi:hypothetical protein